MNVFLSYRRADTVHLAHHLRDQLGSRRGISAVFQDIESLDPGDRYDEAIRETIEGSEVVLVLIGSEWEGSSDDAGQTRLFGDDDVVRHEVRLALEGEKRLIPVLVDDREMPSAGELPPDIAALSLHNAVRLRSESLGRDIEALVDTLDPRPDPVPWGRWIGRALLGGTFAVVFLFVVAIVYNVATGRELQHLLGSRDAVTGLIVVTLLAGFSLPLWWPVVRR